MLLRVTVKDPDLKFSPRFFLSEHGSNRLAIDYSTSQLSKQKRLYRKKHHDCTLKVCIHILI